MRLGCNYLINKNITLVKDQKKKYESDLQLDDFLKEFERIAGYKQVFEFKS